MQIGRTRTLTIVAAILFAGHLTCGHLSAADPKAGGKSTAPEAGASAGALQTTAPPKSSMSDDVEQLKQQLSLQEKQIEQLRLALEEQKQLLEKAFPPAPANEAKGVPTLGQVASMTPVLPASAPSPAQPGLTVVSAPGAEPASAAQVEAYTQKVDALGKTVDILNKGLAGFKFSGDLRFRYDGIFRSANSVAGPQQNSRERYRVRFNVNKDVSSQFGFHLQLGTGTANNPSTFDSDFAGSNTRNFFWLTEYYGDYHPSKNLGFRAGRMEEVFADNEKFLFDDDVRFNGAQEIGKVNLGNKATVEFRAGQYILTNPNVQILPSAAACAGATPPATCVYEKAGYAPGGKVRDSNLFHQGVILNAKTGEKWNHKFTADYQQYRNPNQFLIASSASAGVPVLVNGVSGVTLAGGVGQLGNGTTTAGGFNYTAPDYHIGRVGYQIDYAGWKTSRQSWPVSLDIQAARNFGGSFLNNAEFAQISMGSVKKAGDLRFLYAYHVKEANSIISQVTDDDIGTGVSVNTRTHYIRVDLGLTKYLQWQNLLYIQDEISGNDPGRNFFVASPARGANTQYRLHSQFAISF